MSTAITSPARTSKRLRACAVRIVDGRLRQANGIAAAGLRLAQGAGGRREELGVAGAVAWSVGDPGAHGDRQAFGCPELQAQVDERVAQAVDRRLEVVSARGRRRDQEFVRADPPQDRPLGEDTAEDTRDLDEGPVAGRMAMGVVEQREVVEVDDGDGDASRSSRPALVQPGRELPDDGSVVEEAGERVATGGLDELVRLPGQPSLGGAEDEEQEDGQHGGRTRGDHDDRRTVSSMRARSSSALR